jgi:hypothetical protein
MEGTPHECYSAVLSDWRQAARQGIGRSPMNHPAEAHEDTVRSPTSASLYAGEQQLSFGDRLTALPMAALWMLDGSAS